MNIRDAILKAAEHIERNPGEFNFGASCAPDGPGCGFPGCALGWIGTFLGMSGVCNARIALRAGLIQAGQSTGTFYDELSTLGSGWETDAGRCAAVLRLYADKYYPAEQHEPSLNDTVKWSTCEWKPKEVA